MWFCCGIKVEYAYKNSNLQKIKATAHTALGFNFGVSMQQFPYTNSSLIIHFSSDITSRKKKKQIMRSKINSTRKSENFQIFKYGQFGATLHLCRYVDI